MKWKWALLWFISISGDSRPQNVELFTTREKCEISVQKVKQLKEIEFITPAGKHSTVPVVRNEAYCVPAYTNE